ncbi:hypothetical protein [Rhizobium chutanense]|uniref:Swt1-like HEPN domain-containing protein n=1 Tax=Rhizobium chutanense TaxID=2035448 RepID=A0A432P2U7_9HYPH|nr:hypothetical protein [Rhizobium chutanense]RUM06400.1 hypothetical protein EFR84_12280 [Rhizobium chutanense]
MILEPEYFNTGIMKKMDVLVQDGIGPVLARMLKDRVGPNWLQQLNEQLKLDRNPIQIIDGRPTWDFNQILHAVQFYGRRSALVDARQEKELALTLKGLRNGISHAGYENIHQVASNESTLEFMRAGKDLLQRFGAVAQARIIATAIHEYEEEMKKTKADPPENSTREHDASPKEPPKQESAKDETSEATKGPETEHADTASAFEEASEKAQNDAPTSSSEHRARESIILPKPKAGVLWFPIIGDGKDDDFGYFSVTRNEIPQPNVLVILPGLPDPLKPVVQQIVNDTRATEAHDLLCTWTTRFRSGGTFVGPSFGLAAAFADRSARYGLRRELEDMTIIATGTIIPNKGGAVDAISGLYQKMALIETSPHSRDLNNILFLFPAANLDGAEERTRLKLNEWNGVGSRVKWRAVKHIDDLNDLLGSGESEAVNDPAVAVVINEADLIAPVAEAQVAKPSDPTPPDAVPAAPAPQRRSRLLLPMLGVPIGLAALGAVVGIVMIFDRPRIDPVQLQQSDLRIQNLVDAAAAADRAPTSKDLCEALGTASEATTEFDKSRLTPEASKAAAQWTWCHNQFAASDGRLSQVEQLAFDVNAGDDTKTLALAQATQAVSPFDMSRAQSDLMKRALATGNIAIAQAAASRDRISAVSAIWQRVKNGDEQSQPDLERGLRDLTDADMKIASTAESGAIADAKSFLDKRYQQASRLAAFKAAGTHFSPEGDYLSTKAYIDAYDALSAEDKSRLSVDGKSRNSGIQQARDRLAASAKRLSIVTNAFRTVSDEEARGNLRFADLQALVNSVANLTDFDESAMSPEAKDAFRKANDAPAILAESGKRISIATNLAFEVKIKNFKLNSNQYDALQSSIEALQPLDIDRLSKTDRAMLVDACKASPSLAPGMVAPEYNLACNKL